MIKNNLAFFSCVGMTEFDNKIWFAARETNGLFCMATNGSILEYIGMFPNEMEDGTYLYGECGVTENNIVFVPFWAKELAVYNIKNRSYHKFVLDEKICNSGYFTYVAWNDEIILLPAKNSNRVIIRINIKNRTIQCINDWQNYFEIDDKIENLFFDYCIEGNILYAPVIASKGQILKYNLEKNEIGCIQVNIKESCRSICCDGHNFYLCSQAGNQLVIVNKYFEEIEVKFFSEYETVKIKNIFYLNGHVFLFTINSYESELNDMIIEYDVNSKKIQTLVSITALEGRDNYARLDRQFAVCCNKDGTIYALYGGNGVLYKIDSKNLYVSKNKMQRIDALSITSEKYFQKEGKITLFEKRDGNEFLDFLLQQNISNKNKQIKNYGEIIWKKINL